MQCKINVLFGYRAPDRTLMLCEGCTLYILWVILPGEKFFNKTRGAARREDGCVPSLVSVKLIFKEVYRFIDAQAGK